MIHKSQSTFLLNHLITDNAIVAFVVFHSMQGRSTHDNHFFVLKLDMTKAINRVERGHLEFIMTAIKFPRSFI